MKTISGREITKLALGTWGLGGIYDIAGRPAGIPTVLGANPVDVVRYALERGVNLLDCSAMYGRSETVVGRAIVGGRQDVFITTKCGLTPDGGRDFSMGFIERSLLLSLKALSLDVVDLFQVALGPGDSVYEPLAGLSVLHQRGLSRYIGLSVATSRQVRKALAFGCCDCLQLPLNLIDTRCWETARQAAAAGVFLLVKSPLNKGVLCMNDHERQFQPGDSRQEYLTAVVIRKRLSAARALVAAAGLNDADLSETAIRFVLSIPFVGGVLFGARTTSHIDRLAKVAERPPFSRKQQERLLQASRHYFPLVAGTF